MAREIIGFKIELKDDVIRISQEYLGDENFIVISLDQVDSFCQTLKEERNKLKK